MKKLLILRTAPLEQITYALSKIREYHPEFEIACVGNSKGTESLNKTIAVVHYIPYDRPFFKLYYMFNLLSVIKKDRYDAIAFFYNNIPRKGYGHIEWFCFFTGIKKIFLCDEDGSVQGIHCLRFLAEILVGKYLEWIGNVFAFFIIWGVLAVAYGVRLIRLMVNGVRKKLFTG